MKPLSPSAVKYKMNRLVKVNLEDVFHRNLIQAALKYYGGTEREKLFQILKDKGASRTRFNLAMTYLHRNKIIWKVGKEWELRTETANLK